MSSVTSLRAVASGHSMAKLDVPRAHAAAGSTVETPTVPR
jgi:hypothetical protein